MATSYKSEFSAGNGKLIGSDALQVSISNNVALGLSASVLFNFGADGFALSNNTFDAVALGTGGYVSGNAYLPTRGYVDEAIASAAAPGDATKITFSGGATPSATFPLKTVVSLTSSGLAKAVATDDAQSNAFGVVVGFAAPSSVIVQVDGEAAVSDLAAFTKGDLVWVSESASGTVTSYGDISVGNYATQVGIVSDVGADKIILQPRIFGQV